MHTLVQLNVDKEATRCWWKDAAAQSDTAGARGGERGRGAERSAHHERDGGDAQRGATADGVACDEEPLN